MTDRLDAAAYDDLLAELETTVDERRDGDAADDAVVWEAVGDVVPRLTSAVCEDVLELAAHDPDPALVEEVVQFRQSDDDERLRAEAVTALVADLQDRVHVPEEGDER